MKILEIKKRVLVLTVGQLSHIKGGTDNQNTSDIIIIDDVDNF